MAATQKAGGGQKRPAAVLDAGAAKKSLGGGSKAQPKRKVVINTLDSPLDIRWPRLDDGRQKELHDLLSRWLGPARAPLPAVPKEAIVGVSRAERKQRRKEWRAAQGPVDNKESLQQRSRWWFGLRDVVRAVETGAAAAVVCERKAQPPQLTRLLVPLCRARAVPLLALNDLSRHVGAKLGLPRCLTLALKVSACSSGDLRELHEKLLALVDLDDGVAGAVAPPLQVTSSDVDGVEPAPAPAPTVDSRRFYLRRPDASQVPGRRAFVPGRANPLVPHLDPQGLAQSATPDAGGAAVADPPTSASIDFIALDKTPTQPSTAPTLWKAVRVIQRVAGDHRPDRNQRTGP